MDAQNERINFMRERGYIPSHVAPPIWQEAIDHIWTKIHAQDIKIERLCEELKELKMDLYMCPEDTPHD